MGYALLIPSYFAWHYGSALRQIFKTWLSVLWYIVHLFSLTLMVRTLFAPWHRMTEHRNRGDDLEETAAIVLINVMSRLVGMCIKLPFIILGVVMLAIAFPAIGLFYLFWILAPLVIVGLIGTGLTYMALGI